MLFVAALVLALIFLPWPWSLAVIAGAATFEVGFWTAGIRYSRARRAQVGVQTLVGQVGEATTTLAPAGQVKVNGELWEARAEAGARTGDAVRVTAVDGLVLTVERA